MHVARECYLFAELCHKSISEHPMPLQNVSFLSLMLLKYNFKKFHVTYIHTYTVAARGSDRWWG
jgi:hypothetical protein